MHFLILSGSLNALKPEKNVACLNRVAKYKKKKTRLHFIDFHLIQFV